MDLHKIQDYVPLLLSLQEANPNIGFSCIAGGAIRDCYFKKPVKDIDIFYTGEIEQLPKEWDKDEFLFDADGYDEVEFEVTHKEVWAPDVMVPIQLIKVGHDVDNERIWAEKLVCDFPCSLSQAALSLIRPIHGEKTALLVHSQKWMEHYWEIDNNTKKVPIWWAEDCPEKYKKRVLAKYKDWYTPKKPMRILNARPNVGLGGNNLQQGVAI